MLASSSESAELLTLYDSSPVVLQAMSHTGVPIAVSVSEDDLNEVPGSVLMVESWIRNHVLAHHPSTNITIIVVGNTVLCNKDQEDKLRLVLPSLRNVYYSLTRWDLEKDIKVSAAFSSNCLNPDSVLDRDDLADKVIKPLLSFLELTNSTYSINPPTNFSPLSDESAGLVSSHSESMKKLRTSKLRVNVIVQSAKEGKPQSRKPSFMHSKFVEPYPTSSSSKSHAQGHPHILSPTYPSPRPDLHFFFLPILLTFTLIFLSLHHVPSQTRFLHSSNPLPSSILTHAWHHRSSHSPNLQPSTHHATSCHHPLRLCGCLHQPPWQQRLLDAVTALLFIVPPWLPSSSCRRWWKAPFEVDARVERQTEKRRAV
uniref:glucan endo-1,3-beta-D-glucosidase n=1 Tax=Vitis vinifera TaxID=29760 RepID=F6HXB6_VITVI